MNESLEEERLCTNVAMGWGLIFLMLLAMLVSMTVAALATDNIQAIVKDPSPRGIRMLIVFMAFYGVFPLVLRSFRCRALRWASVLFAVFLLLFFVAHHVGHYMKGERPDINSHLLDIAHHTVAIWLIWMSIKWARFSPG